MGASQSNASLANMTLVEVYDRIGANINLTKVSFALFAIVVLRVISRYQSGLKAVGSLPGFRVPFFPIGIPGALISPRWWNPGYLFTWDWRNTNHIRFGNDTFSVVSLVSGPHALYTASLEVARQTIGGGHKTSFVKPELFHRSLLYWGPNLVAADKDLWRKHRRIVGPAFNNDLSNMVWTETLHTYKEMTAAEGWDDKKEIDIPIVQKITFKLALLIIGRCGFGFKFNWFDPPKAADGFMSIQEALRIVADTSMQAILLPRWIRKLPFKKFRESYTAYEQMADFMDKQITERRADVGSSEEKELGKDVFTLLVQANEHEIDKLKLTDQELIGNVFVLIFAGHETTAHTLAAILGFLSLYPEIQQEVYQQIISVIGTNEPKFEDCNRLDKILNVLYETLRLFPSGHLLIREAWEDAIVQIPNPPGEEGSTSVPIAKGTLVITDMIGVREFDAKFCTNQKYLTTAQSAQDYNPRYFPDPFEFKPSRWEGVSIDSEVFTAFSVGARACVGRKFATVESICWLACLLRDFEVQPLLEPGETKDGWRTRVLDARMVITLGVKDVPIRFIRRS